MRAAAALAVLVMAVVGCNDDRKRAAAVTGTPPAKPPVAAGGSAGTAGAGGAAMAGDWASPLGDASLYDLEVEVRGGDGDPLPLRAFAGGPVLITMFYGSCPAACPRLIDDLYGLDRALPEEVRHRVRIVLVSFDPERDTPAALKRLAADRKLDERWSLTAAEPEVARELAAALGIKYRALDGGEFFHTSVITALDAVGRPLARIEGLGRDPEAVVQALRGQ